MQLPNPVVPYFAAEGAAQQDMIHGLRFLVTNDTSVRLLQAMVKPPIRRPTASVHHQPIEEFDSRRRRGVPNLFSAKRCRGAKEHGAIGGRRRVVLVGRQILRESVRLCQKLDPIQEITKTADLKKHLHCLRSSVVAYPCIAIHSLGHYGLLLPDINRRIDRRRECHWARAIEPVVSPEEGQHPIPQGVWHVCLKHSHN